MEIKDISKEELQEELDRRENISVPPMKPLPDLTELRELLQDYINGKHIKGVDHYIYGAAVEAFFGEDVWGYINENLESER